MAEDPLSALSALVASEARLPSFRRGFGRVYVVTEPEDVEYVLQTNAANFDKTRKRAFLGRGIVGSRGRSWEKQRAVGLSALRGWEENGRLEVFVDEVLGRWEGHAAAGRSVPTLTDLSHLNLRHVGASLFGVDLGPCLSELGHSIGVLVGREPGVLRRALLGDRSEYGRSLRALRAIGRELAAQVSGKAGSTPFTLALLAGKVGVPLADQLTNYLLAAGETTTMALAWVLQLLAWNRHAQISARRSVAEGKGEYLRAVVRESLRLFPPVWAIARRAKRADSLAGVRIRAGAELLLVPYLTHRHPGFWREPGVFRPERFLVEPRPRAYSFLPFGAGPRSCLGAQFALDEVERVVGRILLRFRLRPAAASPERALALFTLRPASGAPLRLRRIPNRVLPHKELAPNARVGENLENPFQTRT